MLPSPSPELLWVRLLSRVADAEAQQLHRAYILAERAHRGQWRDGGEVSYLTHPLRVALILAEEVGQRDPSLLAIALLHDTLEDTDLQAAEIAAACGDIVAEAVTLLTKPLATSDEKPARDAAYFAALAAAGEGVRGVKCADRLDNLRSMRALNQPARLDRYLQETRRFVLPLAAATSNYLFQSLSALCEEPNG